MKRDYWLYVALGAAAVLGAWVLFVGLPRWYPPDTPPAATGTPTAGARVATTLFYISDDGMQLVEFERRLEQRAEPAAQARVVAHFYRSVEAITVDMENLAHGPPTQRVDRQAV